MGEEGEVDKGVRGVRVCGDEQVRRVRGCGDEQVRWVRRVRWARR